MVVFFFKILCLNKTRTPRITHITLGEERGFSVIKSELLKQEMLLAISKVRVIF